MNDIRKYFNKESRLLCILRKINLKSIGLGYYN